MPSIIMNNNKSESERKDVKSKTRLPRVINVSSLTHTFCPKYQSLNQLLDYCIENKCFMGDKKEYYDPLKAYALSKACNILFTRELQKRYSNKLIAVSLHPGVIKDTNLTQHMSIAQLAGFVALCISDPDYFMDDYKSISQGAATTLRCVSLDDNEIEKGGYYHNCQCAWPSGKENNKSQMRGTVVYDKKNGNILANKLWQLSELLIADRKNSVSKVDSKL